MPFIVSGWNSQCQPIEAAGSIVTVSLVPGCTSWLTLSSSSVKLCSVVSSFVTSIVVEPLTVSVDGLNVKSLIVMV